MTHESALGPGRVWGVAVTFGRPTVLEQTLLVIGAQTRPPDELVVVDNGSDAEVAMVARRHGAKYVDSGANVGPAGGFATGMRHVMAAAGEHDWILLIDDDDPPASTRCLEHLVSFATTCVRVEPRTAGVGNGGSRYRRRTGTFERVGDSELTGPVAVDTLFGGSQPLYRCAAITGLPSFDERLFWGFEEADYGLSLRAAGYSLFIDGPTQLVTRRRIGTTGITPGAVRTPLRKAAWRRYYSVRNSTVLAVRYGSPWARFYVAAGGSAKGVMALARQRRPIGEVTLPLRGAWDGLAGNLGRTVDPGSNVKGH